MDRLLVFGTGNATVTECYNTCFSLTLSLIHISEPTRP